MSLLSIFDLSAEDTSIDSSVQPEQPHEEEFSFFSFSRPISFTCTYSKTHSYTKAGSTIQNLFKSFQVSYTKKMALTTFKYSPQNSKTHHFVPATPKEKATIFGADPVLSKPYSLKQLSSLLGLTTTKTVSQPIVKASLEKASSPFLTQFFDKPSPQSFSKDLGPSFLSQNLDLHPKNLFDKTNNDTIPPSLSKSTLTKASTKYISSHKTQLYKDKRYSLNNVVEQSNFSNSSRSTSSSLKKEKNENKEKDSKDQQKEDHPEEHVFDIPKKKESKNFISSPKAALSCFPFSRRRPLRKNNEIEKNVINTLPPQKQMLADLKPNLPLPHIGVFALYYILTKQGILSDFSAYSSYKNDMEITQKEIDLAYEDRLGHLKKAVLQEKSLKRWGSLTKFFSWLSSFVATVAGAVLMCSGVGSIVGAMVFVAGVFSLTNAVMEWTGAWKKIAEILPGDDPDKKKTVVSWIRLGINFLCLIFSIVGVVWGGYASAMRAAQSVFRSLVGILVTGFGISSIGEGIVSYKFHNEIASMRESDVRLEVLDHTRISLMERGGWDLEQLEKLFEKISYVLELNQELFIADMSINRRY